MFDYEKYQGFTAKDADLSILIDSRGVQRTENLFSDKVSWETKAKRKKSLQPIYCMRNVSVDGLPSAYQIFMHSIDEYDAAMKLVGSLKHWRKLCNLKWFSEGIKNTFEGVNIWREDMSMRDASGAKRQLLKAATNGDASAARKIFDNAVPKQPKKPVGKPKGSPEPDGEPRGRLDELHEQHIGSH